MAEGLVLGGSHHMHCALYLYYYYISSTSDHHVLDSRDSNIRHHTYKEGVGRVSGKWLQGLWVGCLVRGWLGSVGSCLSQGCPGLFLILEAPRSPGAGWLAFLWIPLRSQHLSANCLCLNPKWLSSPSSSCPDPMQNHSHTFLVTRERSECECWGADSCWCSDSPWASCVPSQSTWSDSSEDAPCPCRPSAVIPDCFQW